MLKGPVLPLALLLSSPALYSAFVAGTMGATTALVRFMVAVVVAAMMLSVLRSITADYQKEARRRQFLSRLPADLKARVEADRD